MKRRTFLQRVSSTLAALGLTEAGWLTLGNRYYQALAQPTPRKLALLVGINQYPQTPSLSGCLVDVELQRELLLYRFGFQPADILTLTEQQATRENIETAFVEHLIKQASPDDVVVFHFSGYGSRIQLGMEGGDAPQTLQNALIPVDGISLPQETKKVNYLLEQTLLLLLRSLATDRVTAVLDTSYNTPAGVWQGGLKIRARPELVSGELSQQEIDFQKQLTTDPTNRVSTETPGLLLTSTSNPNQIAAEVLMSGFSAGLFTYALTQELWEATPATTIQVSLNHVAIALQQLGGKQQPGLLNDKKNREKILIAEHFIANSSVAEGVVTAVEDDGKTAQLWLGGLPPQVLENYAVNSRFALVTPDGGDGNSRGSVQMILRSRAGLTAKAQIATREDIEGQTLGGGTPPLRVGQLVQETVRLVGRHINLTIALDTALERIERVDATSAFSSIPHVSSTVAGEQPADYVFGKLPKFPTADLPATGSLAVSASRYGLFSLAQELIPNTGGEPGEAVKLAVQRLATKIPPLVAAKMWRLTVNEGSSRLGVKATLEIVRGIPQIITQRQTQRPLDGWGNPGLGSPGLANPGWGNLGRENLGRENPAPTGVTGIPTIPIGSRIQYRVQNTGTRPLYLMLLGLDSTKSAIALYPWSASTQFNNSPGTPVLTDIVVAPDATITIPQSIAGSEWVVNGPGLVCETQLICSTSPFTQTLAALLANQHPIVAQQRIYPLTNSLEVAQALLQDLHNASDAKTEINGAAADAYVLDVNNWATLSFAYQVV
ncbi:MAG: caspase family protein [Nostocaceae cyanobacterium]|nr:caspase family protein [Nostocaceae cyanobacterium]